MEEKIFENSTQTAATTANIFEFSNQKCSCNVDTRYDKDGKMFRTVWVRPGKEAVKFAHIFKEGIQTVDAIKKQKLDAPVSDEYCKEERPRKIDRVPYKSPIKALPITEEFRKLSNRLEFQNDGSAKEELPKDTIKDEDLAKNLTKYFSDYGFLSPIYEGEFTAFSPENLGKIFNRLKTLLLLIGAVDAIKKDYNKIFAYTFMLALTEPPALKAENSEDVLWKLDRHPLAEAYISIKDLKAKNDTILEAFLDSEYPDEKDHIDAILYPSSTAESKEIEEHDDDCECEIIPPSYAKIYATPDYFFGEGRHNFVREIIYNGGDPDEPIYSVEFLTERNIAFLHVHMIDSIREEKLFYDFLFHLHYEVSKVKSIDTNSLLPIEFFEEPDLNRSKEFDEHFKKVLTELANMTIKTELDNATNCIRPYYNAKEQRAGWLIPDFISAIYYSVFLTDRTTETFRICANPGCKNIVPGVSTTNSKKLFCGKSCCSAMTQRKSRKNRKVKDAKRIEIALGKK